MIVVLSVEELANDRSEGTEGWQTAVLVGLMSLPLSKRMENFLP